MSIKINIGSLKDGGQQLLLETDSAELGIEENIVKGSVIVMLELFKTNDQLDIRAKVTGIFSFICDRCLEVFDKPFEQSLELVYAQKSPREEEYNDDYMRTYNANMKTIDITNDIREMVMLAVPMRRLPDEKKDGSCSWCGKTKEYWQQFIVNKED
jgi:uncharacterized metal-binding protein YceD (DUF177 family)